MPDPRPHTPYHSALYGVFALASLALVALGVHLGTAGIIGSADRAPAERAAQRAAAVVEFQDVSDDVDPIPAPAPATAPGARGAGGGGVATAAPVPTPASPSGERVDPAGPPAPAPGPVPPPADVPVPAPAPVPQPSPAPVAPLLQPLAPVVDAVGSPTEPIYTVLGI